MEPRAAADVLQNKYGDCKGKHALLAALAASLDLDVRPVPDVNHYTIVLSRRGAAAVADAVRGLA